jgi:predicted component of type VI protein secretion system
MSAEQQKFEISIKDMTFIVSLIITAAGSWFSQSTRIREIELRFEAEAKINALTIKNLEAKVLEIQSRIETNTKPKK